MFRSSSVVLGALAVFAGCTSYVSATTDGADGGPGDGGLGSAGRTDSGAGASSSGASGTREDAGGDAASDLDAGPDSSLPVTYGDPEWALWKMPNTPGGSLPNPSTYSANDGVVTDQVTGLAWLSTTSADAVSFTTANATCDALTFGGRDDWRLPTAIELFSIVDAGQSDPSLDATVFPSIPPGTKAWYWTSSPLADGSGKRWAVQFRQGGGYSDAFVNGTACSYRCVAGAPVVAKPAHYLPDFTFVTDAYTGLVWQLVVASGNVTQLGAADYCHALALGDVPAGTWRAPTMNELETLVDRRVSGAATLDTTVFVGAAAGQHWTSSLLAGYPGSAWAVDFSGGHAVRVDNDELKPVRCVH